MFAVVILVACLIMFSVFTSSFDMSFNEITNKLSLKVDKVLDKDGNEVDIDTLSYWTDVFTEFVGSIYPSNYHKLYFYDDSGNVLFELIDYETGVIQLVLNDKICSFAIIKEEYR